MSDRKPVLGVLLGIAVGAVATVVAMFAFAVYSDLTDQNPAVESMWIRGTAVEPNGPGTACVVSDNGRECATLRLAPGSDPPAVGQTYWFLGVRVVDDDPFSSSYWLRISETSE